MKNVKLMGFLFVLLRSGFVFSAEEITGFEDMPLRQSERAIYNDFTPVNLMDRDNNSSLSTVGFYNGHISNYLKLLRAQYPDKSCLQRYEDTKEIYEDCTDNQRCEHVMQDALIQRKISNDLGDIDLVRGKYNQAKHSAGWWKNIAYFGFAGNSQLKCWIQDQVFVQKVSDFRVQKYQELLKKFCYISSNDKKMFAQKYEGYEAYYDAVDQEYKGLCAKVEFNLKAEALIQEKHSYQRVVALTWLTVLSAASVGGYLWATKK